MRSALPTYVPRLRRRAVDFVKLYLDTRVPGKFVGEFLDTEGCQLSQFGLGGTAFLLAIKQKHDLNGKTLTSAEDTILKGLNEADVKRRSDAAEHLLKDINRIPVKTILLALLGNSDDACWSRIRSIFENGCAGDLIKCTIDDESPSGDIIITSYIIQILHFSGRLNHADLNDHIRRITSRLEREIDEVSLALDRQLFISTTLCLIDYAKNIRRHRTILLSLYGSSYDWVGALKPAVPFGRESLFLDIWYPDHKRDKEKHRYIRIPIGYIILSAIYVALGTEKAFFSFRPVKELLNDYAVFPDAHHHVSRMRGTSYYVFFAYVLLHPEKYFKVPTSNYWVRQWNSVVYFWKNLTYPGVYVVFTAIAGLFVLCYNFFDLLHSYDQWSWQKSLISVLSLLLASTGIMRFLKVEKRDG